VDLLEALEALQLFSTQPAGDLPLRSWIKGEPNRNPFPSAFSISLSVILLHLQIHDQDFQFRSIPGLGLVLERPPSACSI